MHNIGKGWSRVFVPRPRARARLICFPHAGGAATTYRDWARQLPDSIELVAVQYPGRHDRADDPLPPGIPELAEEIARVIAPKLSGTTAFFGHSMGAMVAFEVARRLRPRFPAPLAGLYVSACNAPPRWRPRGLSFTDDELKDYLRRLGGEGSVSLADDDLWQVVGPVLRGDLRLTEGYRNASGAPLTFPITAVHGDSDEFVTADAVKQWHEQTIGAFESHVFPGGHFYYEDSLPKLLELLTTFAGQHEYRSAIDRAGNVGPGNSLHVQGEPE
nr:thioesterase [uncultured bacterium]